MIDFHTHTLFSDGELVPSELVRRAVERGYRAIALTDHADHSNYDFIIPRIVRACTALAAVVPLKIIPGIELTYVHPSAIKKLAEESRALGAKLIVVHGETIVEPVIPGTNRAALEAGVDILAHPGLITEEEAFLAAARGVRLEVTARRGHSLTNGHVVSMARRCGAELVLNTDTHGPGDLITRDTARRIAAGAGMSDEEIEGMFLNAESLCEAVENG
ncbi:MAG: histidinol phosphate phosphatase domain-containing protein [Syntrophales bacterium]|nr:histidinol phosphate phosphatase domain-containing protein [Syntrophales bacterium]MCK9528290.1 histidinol phosphate phosphatase domain-containing protein [Syntrophales bacterium]MDX9922422.1 histidinol phosphate phosphatase domain-containing protein [Syntrophales bacterium]